MGAAVSVLLALIARIDFLSISPKYLSPYWQKSIESDSGKEIQPTEKRSYRKTVHSRNVTDGRIGYIPNLAKASKAAIKDPSKGQIDGKRKI